jgi:hypothetical protein
VEAVSIPLVGSYEKLVPHREHGRVEDVRYGNRTYVCPTIILIYFIIIGAIRTLVL